MISPPDDLTTVVGSRRADLRRYLLVIDGSSSTVFPLPTLPTNGDIVLGRAQDAGLRLSDPSASRHHAQLCVNEATVTIRDLGSQNGTLVNGERITAPTVLRSGDVVALCAVTLVYHCAGAADATSTAGSAQRLRLLTAAALCERLDEELLRAGRHQTALSLLCARGLRGVAPEEVLGALTHFMQAGDLLALDGDEALLLLPETGASEIRERGEQALALLAPLAPQLRLGSATYPDEGADADCLLRGARGSAQVGATREHHTADSSATFLELGARRVVVADEAMRQVFTLLRRLAQGDLPVLLCGPTGSGKEIAATALHHWSPRSQGRMVALNCAALPEGLIEGELFGYEKGAFSGAVAAKPGLLESAHEGVVFLDEIAELPLPQQAKLLRVLETHRVTRVGGLREQTIDIRIVSASHRDLRELILAGRFREDLYYRLSAAVVTLPPLRDRRRELVLLARTFLNEACVRAGRSPLSLSDAALRAIHAHPWPGNLRELRNAMEFAASITDGTVVLPWHLPDQVKSKEPLAGPAVRIGSTQDPPLFRPIEEELRDIERERMKAALQAAGGQQARAAALIAMPLRSFSRKFKLYGLDRR